MRPLIIDEEAKKEIVRAEWHAQSHIIPLEALRGIMEGMTPPADDPEFCIQLYRGFRVVYSLEQQPVGLVKHISIGVDGNKDDCPHPLAVEAIIKEFGYPPLEECSYWVEDLVDGHAINVACLDARP